ncbi:MAG: glycerate kinase type-2 family protein [Nitrososphaeria archaeon]
MEEKVKLDLISTISNLRNLMEHGNVPGRKIVLEILEEGLRASDPYESTKNLIKIAEGNLIVGRKDFSYYTSDGRRMKGPLIFELSKVGNIYVVGGGKAAQRQAKAIEDVLGDLITEGHINAKKGEKIELKKIQVTLAGHPIPDEDSVEGSKRVMEIEKKARKGDIVFFSESGGASALMALPGPGLTLNDIQEVTRKLYFECGASMWDTNTVRWNLTILRGKDERYVGDATLIAFHTDERPLGMKINVRRQAKGVGGYRDAIDILKKYRLWDKVPRSVQEYLEQANPEYGPIRPGELDGKPQYHFRVMGPEIMLQAAAKKSRQIGVRSTIIASSLSDVEARDVGDVLAYIAREIESYGRPLKPPCVLLCGGELLVTVGEKKGKGGRNQEFVLSTAPRISGSPNIVIASCDSDGTDGPTDAAGGLVDGYTMTRAQERGVDVFEELDSHNSYSALSQLGDLIFTGARGTNVQDLRVIYVGGRTKLETDHIPDYISSKISR